MASSTPAQEKSAKQAFQDLLKTERVVNVNAPRYGKKDELGSLLRIAVAELCAKTVVASKTVEEE